jgi:nucleotide-binding universal stress UspA family protein
MRVLLATDGSEEAKAATVWLQTFPLPRSSRIRVLAVAPRPPALPADERVRAVHNQVLDRARAIVREARDTLAGRWPDIELEVGEGDPREAIVRAAETADLVVVGARGLTVLKRVWLGSVSSAVAGHVQCPVLVVKGRPRGLHTALLAVDGSPDARRAATFLAALPLARGLRLRLLSVVEPPAFIGAPEMGAVPPIEQALRDGQAEAEQLLQQVASEFKERTAVESRVVVGRAGERIVAAANDAAAELVVVGARGLGTFQRLLLGSVSEYVLQHAECPVLIVREGQAGRGA